MVIGTTTRVAYAHFLPDTWRTCGRNSTGTGGASRFAPPKRRYISSTPFPFGSAHGMSSAMWILRLSAPLRHNQLVEDYQQGCARLRSVWEYAIAADGGPLPGSVLEPLITPQGWCGRVHGPHSSKVMAVVRRV